MYANKATQQCVYLDLNSSGTSLVIVKSNALFLPYDYYSVALATLVYQRIMTKREIIHMKTNFERNQFLQSSHLPLVASIAKRLIECNTYIG